MENNEGIRYRKGSTAEDRFSGKGYPGMIASAFVEPLLLYSFKAIHSGANAGTLSCTR
ncbi:MAG: hypothetical protein AB9919_03155 [Geobacteraceae bacterium]